MRSWRSASPTKGVAASASSLVTLSTCCGRGRGRQGTRQPRQHSTCRVGNKAGAHQGYQSIRPIPIAARSTRSTAAGRLSSSASRTCLIHNSTAAKRPAHCHVIFSTVLRANRCMPCLERWCHSCPHESCPGVRPPLPPNAFPASSSCGNHQPQNPTTPLELLTERHTRRPPPPHYQNCGTPCDLLITPYSAAACSSHGPASCPTARRLPSPPLHHRTCLKARVPHTSSKPFCYTHPPPSCCGRPLA